MIIREVWLHGPLRKKYGGPFRLAVDSAAEAVRALAMQIPGFIDDVRSRDFIVVRGDLRRGMRLDESQLDMGLGNAHLHLFPVPQGAKGSGGGILKIIVGVVLVAVSIVTGGAGSPSLFAFAGGATVSTIAAGLGVSLVLSGISQLISPTPKSVTATNQVASYVFAGPENVTAQGVAVPVVYGRARCGSVVVAAALRNDFMGLGAYLPYGAGYYASTAWAGYSSTPYYGPPTVVDNGAGGIFDGAGAGGGG